MKLARYRAKRNFKATLEPSGKAKPGKAGERRFVIQKHAARRLHYDFRLEMDGVLKSWAVPKGLPTRRGDRRLAIHVEDHPIEYAGFEGIIPPGNYGAGTVMVWDTGTYSCDGDVDSGKLHVTLAGKKLKGDWTLVRMKNSDKDEWLFFKTGTDQRPPGEDESAVSGRTMKQIAGAADASWESDRPVELMRLPAQKPGFVEPMRARLLEGLPADPTAWVYEIKFDGYRAIAVKTGWGVQLWSRNQRELTDRFAEVAAALRELPCRACVSDGEIVALDDQGRPAFQLLQNRDTTVPIVYYVFDLLNLDGRDTRALPLEERKAMLRELLGAMPENIRFSASFTDNPGQLLQEIRKRGMEGLIGKRRDSAYQPGQRTGAWVKIKCVNEQEFVIGGYTPPGGTRRYFGAVIVGYHDAAGKLRYASKVGSGFDAAGLKAMHATFQTMKVEQCPFVDLPTPSRDPHGIPASFMKRCTWVQPELVCQVRFTEWTNDGHLRQPVFLGLREDKSSREVVREL